MERALLVTINLRPEKDSWEVEDAVSELQELVSACGVQPLENIIVFCDRPTPNFLIGRGKVEEIGLLAQELEVDTIILSHDLSGTQQRNLEEAWGKKTIDRTQLILGIFARRAKSPEGKMQVELAQLEYLLPRLVGKGIILSRQGGGLGTSGPGEKKLEIDRRRVRERIDKFKDDLKGVAAHRFLIRKKRRDDDIPLVVLVGYTSAGKSTLLNALAQARQVVSGSLFITLDPKAQNLKLPNGEQIVISDTVGFLRNLPHNLIEAFKATLEEVTGADLLIHVLDASSAQVYERHKAVLKVLKELRAEEKPIITALNKIDLLDDQAWLANLSKDFINSVPISAKLSQNLDVLLKAIQGNFPEKMMELDILIPHRRMDLVDLFYRQGKVVRIKYLQKGIKIKVNISKILYHKLLQNKEIENNC
ncbi:MAG: GTPase HflX [Candidatus Omnitrophica bacterium CG08_land_8_20_14_0_20_41_16]|uniref:GTPase HflX n=1 Tax=Candidatus Sherwoodlollariibacterium unditelluris TaxID=1974757 RepID=A0A2G9YKT9_9BACT|nr:MAG: GTPase HflX [Candidatus Omnitrophica bacterium CG23_combo_of_CG06-09_8_20_14_all_41_10]PIS33975.1 MAG: GTPase HflX [Candidatus Omnitrophica bacterium CG08_land_8_20_14_0_20_41_16]